MKLYHYVHCPFCIRIRMVLGFLEIPYESIVLPYNDEKTPLHLAGAKMLPIMEIEKNVLNESLDIIKLLDKENSLKTLECISNYSQINDILNELGSDIHSLAIPYFIWTPEFDEDSRKYFQDKKEKKRGAFRELIKNRKGFEIALEKNLNKHKGLFDKKITKDSICLEDILIASHLWAMYIVPEFQYPNFIHKYLQEIKDVCSFNYHGIFWE